MFVTSVVGDLRKINQVHNFPNEIKLLAYIPLSQPSTLHFETLDDLAFTLQTTDSGFDSVILPVDRYGKEIFRPALYGYVVSVIFLKVKLEMSIQ